MYRVLELCERLCRGGRLSLKVRWGILHMLRLAAKDNSSSRGLTGVGSSSLQLLTQSLGSASLHAAPPAAGEGRTQSLKQQQEYSVQLPSSLSGSQWFQVCSGSEEGRALWGTEAAAGHR